jgi:hypothetical protein
MKEATMPAAQGTITARSAYSLAIIAPYRDADGRNRQKWITVKRRPGETDRALRTRAEHELQELIVKLREGEPVPTGRLTLSDYITTQWLPAISLNINVRSSTGYAALQRSRPPAPWQQGTQERHPA